MTSSQIRQQFIDFFKSKGHLHLPESSLVPKDDPSVLLTTAGMQQFKTYFSNSDLAPAKRITTVQPSFRTTDIEEVGDESHNTFFEMLGNFSFGYTQDHQSQHDLKRTPYFKEEAIKMAWELMTKIYQIDSNRMHVTVFEGDNFVPKDEESEQIWQSIGVPKSKIRYGNRVDNFWGPTGDEGPCGSTTEIYVDGVEVWNNVFNEYFQDKNGRLHNLAYQGVDTGMGLERLARVLQKQLSIFETDLFNPLIELILKKTKTPSGRSTRIIADHARGIVFLIADGVMPSNVKQGYILRRLIRRASTHGRLIQAPDMLIAEIASEVIKILGNWYKKLPKAQHQIFEVIQSEQVKFFNTLNQAEKQLEKIKNQAQNQVLSGKAVFDLQSTYGLPIEITKELIKPDEFKIDELELKKELERHQSASRG